MVVRPLAVLDCLAGATWLVSQGQLGGSGEEMPGGVNISGAYIGGDDSLKSSRTTGFLNLLTCLRHADPLTSTLLEDGPVIAVMFL